MTTAFIFILIALALISSAATGQGMLRLFLDQRNTTRNTPPFWKIVDPSIAEATEALWSALGQRREHKKSQATNIRGTSSNLSKRSFANALSKKRSTGSVISGFSERGSGNGL